MTNTKNFRQQSQSGINKHEQMLPKGLNFKRSDYTCTRTICRKVLNTSLDYRRTSFVLPTSDHQNVPDLTQERNREDTKHSGVCAEHGLGTV